MVARRICRAIGRFCSEGGRLQKQERMKRREMGAISTHPRLDTTGSWFIVAERPCHALICNVTQTCDDRHRTSASKTQE
jgi:hypothetical protein